MKMKNSAKILQLGFLLLVSSIGLYAQVPTKTPDQKSVQNLDTLGCAALGYDVVAFFTMPDKTIKGDPKFASEFRGAKYWFSSEENKKAFDASPSKYEPQFGGFCAFAITEGNLRPIQIWTHTIQDGKLILNHNAKAKKLWDSKAGKNLKVANKKWPVVEQKPALYDFIHKGETQESVAATSYKTDK
ncbi:MAG: YHS domain-containing (seleno)protein [Cytophagales bacterium]